MSDYDDFFLKSSRRVQILDLVTISHPNFSKTYRIVRNKIGGVAVTVGGNVVQYDYYPIRLGSKGSKADLDYAVTVQIGDLGELIPQEIDRIDIADGFGTHPVGSFANYRSDNLTKPIFGPVNLIIENIPMAPGEGCSFDMVAVPLCQNATGEIYSPRRFRMLSGWL